MRLIFIRHAEPNYKEHTLTEKGFREAELLAERIKTWDVKQFYSSPLPRAYLTLKPALEALGKEAITVEWLKEFGYYVTDPNTGKQKVPWDFMPSFWTQEDLLYHPENFYQHPLLQTNPDHEKAVMALRHGLDEILGQYGYTRHGRYYRRDPKTAIPQATLVFGGHLGANCEALGYLLGISPTVLQHSLLLAPTAISVLTADERIPGEAIFRAQVLGDTGHLLRAGEALSGMAAFSEPFNG